MGKKIFLSISVVFVFAILFAATIWLYQKPYIYVSLDVNPSIEFTINKFGKVIKTKALNDEGKSILEELELDLKHKNIEEAIEISIDKFIEEGYISGESEVNVIVSAYSEDAKEADSLIKHLKIMIKNKIEGEGFVARIEGMAVEEEVFDKAEDLGVTPGKLDIINNIIDSNGNSLPEKIEDWIEKSANEIIEAADQSTKSDSEEKTTEIHEELEDEDEPEDEDEDEDESEDEDEFEDEIED